MPQHWMIAWRKIFREHASKLGLPEKYVTETLRECSTCRWFTGGGRDPEECTAPNARARLLVWHARDREGACGAHGRWWRPLPKETQGVLL